MTLRRNYIILIIVISCFNDNSTLQIKNGENGVTTEIPPTLNIEKICKTDLSKEDRDFFCKDTVHVCESNVLKSIPNVVLAVLAMVGNGLVIYSSAKGWAVTSIFRKLICGLAFSDFMFGLILLLYSAPELLSCRWVYGKFLCSVIPSAILFCAHLGIGFYIIIAIDRFTGIIFPFSYWLSKKIIWILITLNIVLAIGSVVPQTLTQKISMFNTCAEEMSKTYSRIYSWFLFIAYYLIPIIFTSTVYIILIVWLHKVQLNNNVLNDEQQKIRLKANRSITIVLIKITFFFIVLVMPNKIIWIIKEEFGYVNLNTNAAKNLKVVSDVLYSFHAVVNPLIYAFNDETFRKRLRVLFCFKMKNRQGFKSSISMLSTRTFSAIQLNTRS